MLTSQENLVVKGTLVLRVLKRLLSKLCDILTTTMELNSLRTFLDRITTCVYNRNEGNTLALILKFTFRRSKCCYWINIFRLWLWIGDGNPWDFPCRLAGREWQSDWMLMSRESLRFQRMDFVFSVNRFLCFFQERKIPFDLDDLTGIL